MSQVFGSSSFWLESKILEFLAQALRWRSGARVDDFSLASGPVIVWFRIKGLGFKVWGLGLKLQALGHGHVQQDGDGRSAGMDPESGEVPNSMVDSSFSSIPSFPADQRYVI